MIITSWETSINLLVKYPLSAVRRAVTASPFRAPWGRIHEHWTDSDLVNNSHEAERWEPPVGLNNQWGPDFPESFVDDPHLHVL